MISFWLVQCRSIENDNQLCKFNSHKIYLITTDICHMLNLTPYRSLRRMCVDELNNKIKFHLNPWTVLAAISLKSRRGDRVKRKNSIVLPLAVSFACFFSAKEIGIEIIIKFRYTFISCTRKKRTKEARWGARPSEPLRRPHLKGANGIKVIERSTPLRQKSVAKAVCFILVVAMRFN